MKCTFCHDTYEPEEMHSSSLCNYCNDYVVKRCSCGVVIAHGEYCEECEREIEAEERDIETKTIMYWKSK